MKSTTTMGYLYRNIIVDELKCVEYLKSKNLLSNNRLVCSKKNIDGTECGGQLRETTKSSKKRHSDGTFKKIVTMRCTKKGCQTYQSIRTRNLFFTYTLDHTLDQPFIGRSHIGPGFTWTVNTFFPTRLPHSNEELMKKWIEAIKRRNFKPSQYSRICSDHLLMMTIKYA